MDRDCDNCIYHSNKGCKKWECEGTVTTEDVDEMRKKVTENE